MSSSLSAAINPSYEDVFATLSQIWSEILEIPVEGSDEDFFELGGDSLLALAVARRAQESGLSMPLSGVLRQPTLRALTEAVIDTSRFNTW